MSIALMILHNCALNSCSLFFSEMLDRALICFLATDYLINFFIHQSDTLRKSTLMSLLDS